MSVGPAFPSSSPYNSTLLLVLGYGERQCSHEVRSGSVDRHYLCYHWNPYVGVALCSFGSEYLGFSLSGDASFDWLISDPSAGAD